MLFEDYTKTSIKRNDFLHSHDAGCGQTDSNPSKRKGRIRAVKGPILIQINDTSVPLLCNVTKTTNFLKTQEIRAL